MAQDTAGPLGTQKRGGAGALGSVWWTLMGLRGGDAGLTARANLRLRRALGADAAAIQADAISGSVALRGAVASKATAKAAEEAVRHTRGAHDVMNFLEVR